MHVYKGWIFMTYIDTYSLIKYIGQKYLFQTFLICFQNSMAIQPFSCTRYKQSTRKLFSYHKTIWPILSTLLPVTSLNSTSHKFCLTLTCDRHGFAWTVHMTTCNHFTNMRRILFRGSLEFYNNTHTIFGNRNECSIKYTFLIKLQHIWTMTRIKNAVEKRR